MDTEEKRAFVEIIMKRPRGNRRVRQSQHQRHHNHNRKFLDKHCTYIVHFMISLQFAIANTFVPLVCTHYSVCLWFHSKSKLRKYGTFVGSNTNQFIQWPRANLYFDYCLCVCMCVALHIGIWMYLFFIFTENSISLCICTQKSTMAVHFKKSDK